MVWWRGGRGTVPFVRVGVALLASLLVSGRADAAGPARRLAHYTHQSWTEATGAPNPVLDIAQGKDGFLWLATGEGLFRFDGISFERIVPEGASAADDYPTAVLVAANGDVWTAFKTTRNFAVYRDGVLRFLDAPRAPAWIMAMAEAPDGAVWALTATFEAEVLRLHNGQVERFDAARGMPRYDALSLILGRDGVVWVSTTGAVVSLQPGATRFQTVREVRGNPRLAIDPDGRIWISERGGSYPLTGPGGRGEPAALRAPYPTDSAQIRGAPRFDREGNLWIATRYDGVQRVGLATAVEAPAPGQAPPVVEIARGSDRLSSNVTYQIFEGREGNIWVGTEKGLDRLRPSTVRFEAALTSPAAFGDKLLAASDGTVYIGEARTIYRVRAGSDPEPILHHIVEPQSLCEAPDGSLWIVLPTRVVVWKQRIINSIARPSTLGISYDCAFDRHGDFWYSAHSGGLNRFRNGVWDQPLGPVGADAFAPIETGPSVPTTLERDARNNLVVQVGRQLTWIDGEQRRNTPLDFGAAEPKVLTLYGAPNGDVFAAGAFGLTRYRGAQMATIATPNAPESSRVNGVVQTPDGGTWLAYPRSLVRLTPQELDRAFADRAFGQPGLSLGFSDGLNNRPHSHTQRAIVQGGDGRIWIATETGTLWMDPEQIVRSAVPPGVVIKSVVYDGHLVRDPESLALPAATANIEIDFAALSFSDPQSVRVRYMLEGYDAGWIDPGARRQAFYTNLPPGNYGFRLAVANADGGITSGGAAVRFSIPPTFVQSSWFFVLCGALALLLMRLVHRFRMAQVANRIRARLEERMGERTRIARELHDTLLQTFQGVVIHFQAATNMLPGRPEDARRKFETALDEAARAITEGRDAVQAMRESAMVSDDLGEALSTLANHLVEDIPKPQAPVVSINVEGKPRALHPIVRDDIYQVACEAMRNAVRHARAHSLQVDLHYDRQRLQLRVRDDGAGIDAAILENHGVSGHWGLRGMRERTELIGGTLEVRSRIGAGTEVELSLPAAKAYPAAARRRSFWPRRDPEAES